MARLRRCLDSGTLACGLPRQRGGSHVLCGNCGGVVKPTAEGRLPEHRFGTITPWPRKHLAIPGNR